ncbi:MAG: YkgJ family cysteine cluster protein [Bacillota bacterium]|nr:YkgJ family cysteine cluster protein [Bacillota bacterium]
MKVLLDDEGNVNYDKITRSSTVQELLDAIDIFLKDNELHCDKCEDSCCKKPWAVEFDNVCVNTLCNWDNNAVRDFIQDKLVMKENFFKQFDQYVLKKDANCNFVTKTNLCSIYEQRPIICRLFICSAKSHRYNVIRELIGAAYLEALVSEEKIRNIYITHTILDMIKRNPAVLAKDYSVLLDDIILYAQEEGWLDVDDLQELYQAL